jgi:adenosylcobinamide-GDP ribazoletransferase
MRAALEFLTILPVRGGGTPPGRAAVWFPLVGALLGLAAAVVLATAPFGAILALLTLVVLTGGLHEDAVADVCDALRAHRSREKMLAILDDSRIGAHGALGLIFSVVIRWQALHHLQGEVWLRLPAACGIARASMVLMGAMSRPAGEGLGAAFVRTLSPWGVSLVVAQSVVLAALAGWQAALMLMALNLAGILVARAWFHARLGGVNGDCLGFTCQLSETLSLVILACV